MMQCCWHGWAETLDDAHHSDILHCHIIPKRNENCRLGKLTFKEFMRWHAKADNAFFEDIADWRAWFSRKPMYEVEGALFRMWDIISTNGFDNIYQALCFFNAKEPEFVNRFYHTRQMWECFKNHMAEECSHAWHGVFSKQWLISSASILQA